MIEGYKWYTKEQAKEFAPILSCFRLILKDSSGDTCPGYYTCGHFYCEDIDLTSDVIKWMIPQAGEKPHPNN